MTRVALLAVMIAACGGDDGGGGNPDAPGSGTDAPPGGDGFRIERAGLVHVIEPGNIYAAIYDRAQEAPLPERIASDGDCAVYHRPTPSCTACTIEQACVGPEQCAPFARPRNAGTIDLAGLHEPASLTWTQYGYVAPSLPDDLFADDATIQVTAPGDAVAGFAASVGGVAPLVHQITGGVVEGKDGEAETIRWTAAPGGARIQIALYLGWHGTPWTDLLVCETADDGEHVIPAAMIEAMPYFEFGLFQWPSWIQRFRRVWIDGAAGPIEIIAASQSQLGFSHVMD